MLNFKIFLIHCNCHRVFQWRALREILTTPSLQQSHAIICQVDRQRQRYTEADKQTETHTYTDRYTMIQRKNGKESTQTNLFIIHTHAVNLSVYLSTCLFVCLSASLFPPTSVCFSVCVFQKTNNQLECLINSP